MGKHSKYTTRDMLILRIVSTLLVIFITAFTVSLLASCSRPALDNDLSFGNPALSISHKRIIGDVQVTTNKYPQTLTVHLELFHWQLIRIHKGGWKLIKTATFHDIDLGGPGTTVTWKVTTGCKRGWWRGAMTGYGISSTGVHDHVDIEFPFNKHHNKFVRNCD